MKNRLIRALEIGIAVGLLTWPAISRAEDEVETPGAPHATAPIQPANPPPAQVPAQTAIEKVVEPEQPIPAVPDQSFTRTSPEPDISLDELLRIRDPFRRVVKVDEKNDMRPISELEQFPVEEFKMVGVITGPKKVRAMLRTPGGSTLFVAVNQKVGTRNGHVTRITADYVEVLEKITNILGRTETITQKIEIAPEFQAQ